MDRLTGKTMDCYVEFFSVGDAQAAVNAKTRLGNIHKLGDRAATIQMATQDELLRHLFPKAKNIEWVQGAPMVLQPDEPYNTGFKNFVTGEEMVMLTKHAEFPQRVSQSFVICHCECYDPRLALRKSGANCKLELMQQWRAFVESRASHIRWSVAESIGGADYWAQEGIS